MTLSWKATRRLGRGLWGVREGGSEQEMSECLRLKKEGGRKGGKEGWREGGKEGRREGGRDLLASAMLAVGFASSSFTGRAAAVVIHTDQVLREGGKEGR